ncbi:hypothetical protein BX659_106167 [Orenia metallireducens]|uniref:Bacterial repeat domain-containing protein n=1 Tax=Orenia metallireducens TaxID=1413210 RepID=A0A285GV74_9FIRM|nr:hypothetical protein [Orenia metallireducens]PRX31131.1 hypothetical protein BX659_106167 [Orenia metallireducens]SNY27412.1 hypothetical protein SAMN06265827_11119 [Orenia metallireducens]
MITYVSKRLFPLILITTLVFLLTGCSEDSDEFTKSIIQIEKEGAGTVTKSPDKDAYKIGEKVTLTATPAKNYKFAGWQTADSSDTNKTITLTVQAPIIKVKAIFEKDENASDDDSDNSSGDEESNSGEYQLIVNCESTNHSVLGNEVGEITIRDVENEGITYYSGDNIPAGTKVQIYAEPNGRYDNYYFNYWESEDNTINNLNCNNKLNISKL